MHLLPCTVEPSHIQTRLQVGQSGVGILVGKKYFSLLQKVQTGSGAQLTFYSTGTRVLGRKGSQSTKLASHFHLEENIVA